MLERIESIDALLRHYHKLATVTLNTYIQIITFNPLDDRVLKLARTYNKYVCLFNLYADLRRKIK